MHKVENEELAMELDRMRNKICKHTIPVFARRSKVVLSMDFGQSKAQPSWDLRYDEMKSTPSVRRIYNVRCDEFDVMDQDNTQIPSFWHFNETNEPNTNTDHFQM